MTTARWPRAGARLGWRAIVAGLALALAATLAGPPAAAMATAPRGAATAATAAGTSCRSATGPFSVHGSRVLDASGNAFVSYGLTVPGLQVLNWREFTGLDLAKIAADATDWCANTVRLQLSQDNLLGPNGPASTSRT